MTATEWLIKELTKIPFVKLKDVFEKAKEMEKQQIIESYCYGCKDISNNENIFPRETAEEYYKETFKKD